jgi:hypothetical protein
LCQNLNLLIANGRLGKDRHIGSLTCKESSTVDYCILSPVLFSCVANFEICSFDCLISDVHNALHIELLRKNVISVGNDDNVMYMFKKKNQNGTMKNVNYLIIHYVMKILILLLKSCSY